MWSRVPKLMANLNNFGWIKKLRALNTVLLATLGFTLIFGLNFLASSHFVRVDLTENGRYSLAPETKAFLENLENPATIIVTLTESADEFIFKDVKNLLTEYVYSASRGEQPMLTVEYVDMFQQRSRAQDREPVWIGFGKCDFGGKRRPQETRKLGRAL